MGRRAGGGNGTRAASCIDGDHSTSSYASACHSEAQLSIGCYTGDGAGYTGTAATTVYGRTCQAWAADAPHAHGFNDALAGDANYCRNPDGEAGPWCYTTDPAVRWELCDVPACDASLELDLGAVKDVSLVTLYPWQLAVAALGTYEVWLSDVQGSALGLHRGAAPPPQPNAGLGGAAA